MSLSGVGWRSDRRGSRSGLDERGDGGGQPFLVRVVVAALAVPAQVVAHDRGHLEAAQGVEPGQVRQRRAAAGVARRRVRPRWAARAPRGPTPGKLVPSAKTRNQPSSTRGSPTLQISQSMSAAGSTPSADDVAEPVVAVHQRRCGCRLGMSPGEQRRAVVAARRPARRGRRAWCVPSVPARRPGSERRRRPGTLSRGHVVQSPAASRRRAASGPRPGRLDGRVVEHRLERLARDSSIANQAGSRSSTTTIARHRNRRVGAERRMIRAWRSMSCRPIGRCPSGTALTTNGAVAGLHPVGQPGVPAEQRLERAPTSRSPARLRVGSAAATRCAQRRRFAGSCHRRLPRQAEHALGEDVVLDLVGAAGDAVAGRAEHVLGPRKVPQSPESAVSSRPSSMRTTSEVRAMVSVASSLPTEASGPGSSPATTAPATRMPVEPLDDSCGSPGRRPCRARSRSAGGRRCRASSTAGRRWPGRGCPSRAARRPARSARPSSPRPTGPSRQRRRTARRRRGRPR